MLSGVITPRSIGMDDHQLVHKLLKFSQKSILFAEISGKLIFYVVFLIVFMVMATKQSIYQVIFLALPHSILFGLLAYYIYPIIIWQLIYYSIITFNFILKIQSVNKKIYDNNLSSINKKHIRLNVYKVMCELNKLFEEISEYNDIYWSKFLAIYWVLISTVTSNIVFVSIFGDTLLTARLAISGIGIQFLFTLLYVIHYSSLLCNQTDKTYVYLNSMFIESQTPKQLKLKLMSLIERLGQKRIGFYCWRLFLVNRTIGFEMLSIIALLFMKLIEMSK